jgi:hypothetical protein
MHWIFRVAAFLSCTLTLIFVIKGILKVAGFLCISLKNGKNVSS